jgi:MFS family permease
LPWIAYELTHSSLILGTLFATEIVPVLLFGAFAGVYVDRLNRRHLLLGVDLLRAMLVALIPLLLLAGLLQLWELYALSFSLALLSLASDVATTAVLPALAQSEKTRANAAYQFVMQAAEFAGPVLAGLAIATLGGFSHAQARFASGHALSSTAVVRTAWTRFDGVLPWWWVPGLSLGIVAACDTT